jgi:hypothetical protein
MGKVHQLVGSRVIATLGIGLGIVLALPIQIFVISQALTYAHLMFVQGFRPWRDDVSNLVSFWKDTPVSDNKRTVVIPTEIGKDTGCRDAIESLEQEPRIMIAAHTYAKILARSVCPCESSPQARSEWVKLAISNGPFRGRLIWVCRTKVGLTVAPL